MYVGYVGPTLLAGGAFVDALIGERFSREFSIEGAVDVATCAYLGVPTINKDNLCGSMNKAHTSATSYLAMAADIDQMEGTAANENRGEGLTQPTYHAADALPFLRPSQTQNNNKKQFIKLLPLPRFEPGSSDSKIQSANH